jgi:hypothetical protein
LIVAIAAAAAVLSAGPAHSDPGPGPGMCQFLGDKYNVWYPCNENQPWLQYGTADNPPYGSQLPASECTGISAHNVGCS